MTIRKAKKEDLDEIVRMIANDPLGALREDVDQPEKYQRAFDIIDADENQSLMVAEHEDGKLIGTFQLTFIQYLTHNGSTRVQVESVRVREDYRGKGVGEKIFHWIIDHAREKEHTSCSSRATRNGQMLSASTGRWDSSIPMRASNGPFDLLGK